MGLYGNDIGASPASNKTVYMKLRSNSLKVQGSPGLSAYQIAVENGFVGTEAEWLASLEGATGPAGPAGTGTAGGGGEWITATTTGSGINIITGSTNTLQYANFLTTAQAPGAYLTTAAQSVHTHDYQSTGAYLTTAMASNAGSLFQSAGNYLTTAMQSDAGSNYVGLATTGITGGSATINSSQLQLNIPNGSLYYSDGSGVIWGSATDGISTTITASVATNYLTTAAVSNHTHSDLYQSTGAYLTTAMQSASSSVFAKTGITTATTSGVNLVGTLNTNGLNLGVPAWITTGGAGGGIAASIGGNSTSAGAGYSNVTSGTLILKGGNNITLSQDGANVTISGANIGGAQTGISGFGNAETTYTSGTVFLSAYSNISLSSSVNGASQYIRLSVGNYITTAAASDHTHSNLYQSTGAYLTTAAQSGHTHGSAPSITGSIGVTSNSTAWSISIPAFISTAALSNHTHSDLYQSTGAYLTTAMASNAGSLFQSAGAYLTTAMASNESHYSATSQLSATFAQTANVMLTGERANYLYTSLSSNASTAALPLANSTQWATSVLSSKFLTTAMASNESHYSATSQFSASFLGTGAAASFLYTSASSNASTAALNTSASSNFILTGGSTTNSTAGSDSKITMTSAGLNFGVPKWLTTAMLSDNTSVFQYTSATSAITSNAFAGSATTKFAGSGTTTVSTAGSDLKLTLNSNGLNAGVPAWLTVAAGGGGSVYAGDYVSLSVNGASTTVSVTNLQATSATSAITSNAFATANSSLLLPIGNSTQWATGTLSSALMALSYSSGFQTATLGSTFAQTSVTSGFAKGWSLAGAQTAGTTTQNISQSLYLSGGNMITLSGNASTIVFSVNTASLLGTGAAASFLYTSASSNASTAALATSLSSNASTAAVHTSVSNSFIRSWELEGVQTAGTTGSLQSSVLYLSGGNMLTLSGNSNTIVFSVNTASLLGTGAAASFLYTSVSSNASTAAVHTSVSNSFMRSWELEGVNTAGTTGSLQSSVLYLSGGNNITLSGNSNTIVISAGAGGGGIAASISAGGNSTSSGSGYSNITSGTMFLQGGNNITLSQNGAKISIIGATANGPASIVFSDANGVSWGSAAAGSTTTITASVGAGGAPNRRVIEIIPGEYLTKVITVSATQVSRRVIFNPFWLDGNGLAASTVRIVMSWVTNTTPPVMTYGAGLYSMVNETSYALHDSTTAVIDAQSSSNSAQYSGLRMWDITGMTKTCAEGRWMLGLYFSGTASGAMNGILMGASNWPNIVGFISGTPSGPGLLTAATNNTRMFYPFQGYYSNTTNGLPDNVTEGEVSGGRSADAYDFYAIIKEV